MAIVAMRWQAVAVISAGAAPDLEAHAGRSVACAGERPAAPCPLMLHARELHIRHPRTGEEMNFLAEPPEDFARVLDRQR